MDFENWYRDSRITANYSQHDRPDKDAFSLHTHDKCELYCFLGGKGQFKVEGNSYPLEIGDILIMRLGEAHYIDIDPDFPYTRAYVHFDPSLFDSFDSERRLLEPFNSRERGKINKYSAAELNSSSYKNFINALSSEGEHSRLDIIATLIPLLSGICTAFSDKVIPPEETAIQKIIKHINNNLAKQISLEEICREFYISKPQLCRVFKATTGSTVWEYITAKRLILAQSYIRAGHLPTQIFADCGFGDYSAFYRAYKKRFGISPNEQKKYTRKKYIQ